MDNIINHALNGWLPYRIINENRQLLFRWLYVGEHRFAEPFFDDTILKCRRLTENQKTFKAVSGIDMLAAWANAMDSIPPSAFIFHVSRCGSTLVSQMLGMNEENISLAEVPVFDEILRMPFKQQNDAQTANKALTAAMKFYGSKRNGREKHLFIKTDSWHLMFYRQLRVLYPTTPFVIIYRQPAEVLFSQQRQKGIQAVCGLIEPSVFGFDEVALKSIHPDNYMSLVLEKYFRAILGIIGIDKNILLVNYNEGIAAIIEKIVGFIGMQLTNADWEKFAERSRYHAKNSAQIFTEKYPEQAVTSPNISVLQDLYMQMEKLRLQG